MSGHTESSLSFYEMFLKKIINPNKMEDNITQSSFIFQMKNWFKSMKIEIVMILLVILIFILILGFYNSEDPYLESLKPILSKILHKAGYHTIHNELPIHLRKSNHTTYTLNKQKIYVVSDKPNGERYNQDTLLFVILHEIAHIISPEEHHTKGFYQIEKRLHNAARELGYIRKEFLEKNYPCQK